MGASVLASEMGAGHSLIKKHKGQGLDIVYQTGKVSP